MPIALRSPHAALLIILAVALAVRLALLGAYAPWRPDVEWGSVLSGDATDYHPLALCLLHERSFCGETIRTPGYPLFVAWIYALAGERPWVVLAVQALVDLVTIALTHRLAMRRCSPPVAHGAALLLALDPTSVLASSSLLADTLFACLCLAAVTALVEGLDDARWRWAAIAGAMLGVAALVRPSAQYLPWLLVALVLCGTSWPRQRRLGVAAVLVLAYGLAISPWLWRNHVRFDAVALSTVTGDVLLQWQLAYALSWADRRPLDEVRRDLHQQAIQAGYQDGGNPFANSAVEVGVAWRQIQERPADYLAASLRGAIFLYANLGTSHAAAKLGLETPAVPLRLRDEPSWVGSARRMLTERSGAELLLAAGLGLVQATHYLLGLVGLAVLASQRRARWLVVLAGLLALYFSVLSGASAEARYRLPVTPLYLILAAAGAHALLRRLQRGGGLQAASPTAPVPTQAAGRAPRPG